MKPKPSRSIQKRLAIQKRPKQHAIVRRETPSLAEAVEKVLISGDLSPLSVDQRLEYYRAVCKSLGLNPLTRPFDYIVFRESDGGPGRLALYARKDCAEQLRRLYGIWCVSLKREIADEICCVEAHVKDKTGKEDFATGVVALYKFKDGKRVKLDGKELCNAIMKAETKAKRRATLSVCGLGFLDESEIDTMENYNMVSPGGRVIEAAGGSTDRAQEVGRRKLAEHAEGKPIESQPEEIKSEPIAVTPWKEGRVILSGDKGLQIIKSELAQEELNDLGIEINVREKVVHMPAANVFKFIDRAKRCNVEATLVEAPQASQPKQPTKDAGTAATPSSSPLPRAKIPPMPDIPKTPEQAALPLDGDPIIVSTRRVPVGRKELLAVEWDGKKCSCWHKSMWPHLEHHLNRSAMLTIEINGQYMNIIGIERLDGKPFNATRS